MPPAHTISQESRSSAELSTDHFCVRLANAEDFTSIHKLVVMLAIDSEMVEKVKTTPDQLKTDFLKSRFSALVIERFDRTGTSLDIIGYSIFNEKYSTWKGRILWIEDIFITEPYRDSGLGGALLRKLSSIAAKSTMDRIEWCVRKDNIKAITFYEAAGAFDLTAAEDWLLYRFEAAKFKQYLDKPFSRANSIKIL